MALQLDTIIPTTDGYKTVENIKIGDEVFGYENKPIKVIDVLDICEINENYLLTFISTTNESIQVKFVCFEELDYELYMNYLNGVNKGVFEF